MFSLEEKGIIWLSVFSEITPHRKLEIIKSYKDFSLVWQDDIKLRKLLSVFLDEKEIEYIIGSKKLEYIDLFLKKLEEKNIKVITFKSELYPKLLLETPSFPIVLYCKGDLSLLNTDCLGVVGTRRATRYGLDSTKSLVRDIALEGVTIVSGLADGIDKVAHESALDVGGKTIAVLPNGFDNIYPKSNQKLADEIAKKGLLISEYKPKEKTLKYHFPVRNRIIAGISKAVFVVEAPLKSGALITSNYALEFNREIFALPGRFGDIYSEGCNSLIHDCQGSIVLGSETILDFFGKKKGFQEDLQQLDLNIDELKVYNVLRPSEKHFQEILVETGFEIKKLNSILLQMEIKGLITRLPGNCYKI